MKDKLYQQGVKEKIVIDVDDDLVIRTLKPSDINDAYLQWMNDMEVVRYTEQRFVKHQHSDVEKFVRDKLGSDMDFLFGIFFKNRHIGNIKLGPIKWESLSAEVSYLIGNKELWGKGIATKVVKSVVAFGFSELGLKKISAGYYEINIGSAKVLEKCGFSVEGMGSRVIEVEGVRYSSVVVSLTNSKF